MFKVFGGVSLPSVCGPLWSFFNSALLNILIDSIIVLSAADCLSWPGHMALNSLSSDITTSSKKLAPSLLRGGENACLVSTTGPNRTAYMHYDKLPGKKKTLCVIVSFSVCVYCTQTSFASLAKGSHKWTVFYQGWEFALALASSTWPGRGNWLQSD